MRVKTQSGYRIIFFIGLIVILPFAIFVPVLCAILVALGIAFILNSKHSRAYTMLYKENVVRNTLSRHFSNLCYYPYAGLNPVKVCGTGLLSPGRVFLSEDYIRGTHLGVDFEQADIKIYTRRGKGSERIYLKGRWITLRLNRRIDSALYVYDRSFPHYRSAPAMCNKSMNNVELEDVAFNAKYHVIASNPYAAFYALTPQIMSNLSKITAYMSRGGHMPIAFFMYGNEVHVAVHNACNMFEISTKEPLDKTYMEQKIKNEVQLITDVINIFTKYF